MSDKYITADRQEPYQMEIRVQDKPIKQNEQRVYKKNVKEMYNYDMKMFYKNV